MDKLFLFSTLVITLFLSSCGGGSSTSENTEANVTDQCQKAVAVNSTSGVYDNGCDFVVNIDYVFPNGAVNKVRDVQPGGSLYFYVDTPPEIITICRAPSMPSDDSLRCI